MIQFHGLFFRNNVKKERFKGWVHPARAAEAKPKFISGSNLPILNDAFQNNVPVVNIVSSKERQAFSSCSLVLQGSGHFQFCHAFGPKSYSAGGALFCSDSQVFIALSWRASLTGSSFEENSANYGGSIGIFSSDMVIIKTKFSNDLAYLAGGSIFASYNPTHYNINKNPSKLTVGHCFFDNAVFRNCQSKELYGAVGFNCIEEIYLKDCFFFICQSGSTAGALGIVNSFCNLDLCSFIGNSCGNKEVTETNNEILKETYKKMRGNSIKEPEFPKGGGAILIWSEETKDYWNYPSLLETVSQNCCFSTNFIAGSTLNQIITKKRGDDILIAEHGILRSYNDKFDQFDNNISDNIILENNAAIYKINPSIQSRYCNTYEKPPTPNKLTYISPNITFAETNTLFTEEETNNPIATLSDQSLPNTKIPKQTIKNPNPKSKTFTISGFQRYSTIQSPTPTLSQSPTASTGRGTPGTPIRTHIATSYSKYSWDAQPSASSLASRTSSGRTWPTQTPSVAISSPTQSTGKGTPIITSLTPSQSWWGEHPKPTGTASISFENEPTQSELPSQTSSGQTWPTQTPSPQTPTISTGQGTPDSTAFTPSSSFFGDIPKQSPDPTISFEAEPSFSLLPSQTSSDQTWPSATLYVITRTPTASTGIGTPAQSKKRPTISYWGEIPSVTPLASGSFLFAEATPKASQTSNGRTWPTQTLSFSSPTASTGMATPDSTSYTPSQSWFGEIPNITPIETISFLFEPSFSEMATQTSSGRTWPTQTSTKKPHQTPYFQETQLISTSPSQSHFGEFPHDSPTASNSFEFENPYPTKSPTLPIPKSPTLEEGYSFHKKFYTSASFSATQSLSLTFFSTVTLTKDSEITISGFIHSYVESFIPFFYFFKSITKILPTASSKPGEYIESFSQTLSNSKSFTYFGESFSNTFYPTYSYSQSFTLFCDDPNNCQEKETLFSTLTYVISNVPIPVFVLTDVLTDVQIVLTVTTPPPKRGPSNELIIGISFGIAVVLFLIGFVIVFHIKEKKKNEEFTNYEEEEDSFEEEEGSLEEKTQQDTQQVTIITNPDSSVKIPNNPLFETNVGNDTDDMFRYDFEEDETNKTVTM